jgi:hypothetical protein
MARPNRSMNAANGAASERGTGSKSTFAPSARRWTMSEMACRMNRVCAAPLWRN